MDEHVPFSMKKVLPVKIQVPLYWASETNPKNLAPKKSEILETWFSNFSPWKCRTLKI